MKKLDKINIKQIIIKAVHKWTKDEKTKILFVEEKKSKNNIFVEFRFLWITWICKIIKKDDILVEIKSSYWKKERILELQNLILEEIKNNI